jgi:hypothetical protein
MTTAAPAGGHRASVRIGQRDLAIGCGFDPCLHRLKHLHLLAQPLDLLLQSARARLGGLAFLAVGRVEVPQVTGDMLGDLLQALLELVGREVLVAAVHRLELAAVNGDQGAPEQTDLTA